MSDRLSPAATSYVEFPAITNSNMADERNFEMGS